MKMQKVYPDYSEYTFPLPRAKNENYDKAFTCFIKLRLRLLALF